ncbi:hypothetical protein LCGC14_1278300 [marine sediment metagenome]|uniref:Uncharacterized protein n=1 Tax=marine sediment metagenome TaxID=412755 RepID=A0A0F9NZ24_9ZZZZ
MSEATASEQPVRTVKGESTVVAIALDGEGFWVQYKGLPEWQLIAPVTWSMDALFRLTPGKPCPSCGKKVGRRLAQKGAKG